MTEESEKYLCDLEHHEQNCKEGLDESCYVEPANIVNVWYRLPEIITDPHSNQLSASRFVLLLMGVLTVFVSVYLTLNGQGGTVTTLISAVAATSAGVYLGSQFKDLRFKKWLGRDHD